MKSLEQLKMENEREAERAERKRAALIDRLSFEQRHAILDLMESLQKVGMMGELWINGHPIVWDDRTIVRPPR